MIQACFYFLNTFNRQSFATQSLIFTLLSVFCFSGLQSLINYRSGANYKRIELHYSPSKSGDLQCLAISPFSSSLMQVGKESGNLLVLTASSGVSEFELLTKNDKISREDIQIWIPGAWWHGPQILPITEITQMNLPPSASPSYAFLIKTTPWRRSAFNIPHKCLNWAGDLTLFASPFLANLPLSLLFWLTIIGIKRANQKNQAQIPMTESNTIKCRTSKASFRDNRIQHWNRLAAENKTTSIFAKAYQKRARDVFRNLISPGQRVLELGSGTGNLLASLQPSMGMGVDFSVGQLELARKTHPNLQFIEADVNESLPINGTLDAIVIHDLINDVWDIQKVFENTRQLCSTDTRVVITFFSRVWQLPLTLARHFGFARKLLPQNWITFDDARNLLELAGFEVIRHQTEMLFPIRIPILHYLFNILLVRLWPFNLLALSHIVVARKSPETCHVPNQEPKVTVLVPARNEEGNIEAIFDRIPLFPGGTEIIFVEGNSRDRTWETAQFAANARQNLNIVLLQQSGKGKGDAVRTGFSRATGDILLILDADLTVAPEDLPRFVNALSSGKAEFVNGVRLVYPMEDKAMRPLNFLGNKFFSLAFTWLLSQPIKDTLCGTKALWRKDYEKIVNNRSYFGDFDPYGDFDLLFGASKLSLRIVDMPIRYAERTYGTTNINRWTGGALLLRMTLFAARRLKFI